MQLTAADDKSERRYDDDDWDDIAASDTTLATTGTFLSTISTQAAATYQSSSKLSNITVQPPPSPAHYSSTAPSTFCPRQSCRCSLNRQLVHMSSRQGGSEHLHAHFRSKGIDQSSFTTLAPLPNSRTATHSHCTILSPHCLASLTFMPLSTQQPLYQSLHFHSDVVSSCRCRPPSAARASDRPSSSHLHLSRFVHLVQLVSTRCAARAASSAGRVAQRRRETDMGNVR